MYVNILYVYCRHTARRVQTLILNGNFIPRQGYESRRAAYIGLYNRCLISQDLNVPLPDFMFVWEETIYSKIRDNIESEITSLTIGRCVHKLFSGILTSNLYQTLYYTSVIDWGQHFPPLVSGASGAIVGYKTSMYCFYKEIIVVARLPFGLTHWHGFKKIFQAGIRLPSLNATWISSGSWYALNVMGLPAICNLFLTKSRGKYCLTYRHHWLYITRV